ncbi:MAG: hypothetical protein GC179_25670 [Anaerolineaceae bacterium]|nr:hypothetical protein [Anaerolineaceae bacterium]
MVEQSLPVSPPESFVNTSSNKASLIRRFFAFVIDFIILGIFNRFIMLFFPNQPFIPQFFPAAIVALYFIVCYSTVGQTIGKGILGIEIVSADGTVLNWRKGVLRFIGYILSAIPVGLGFLWAIFDRDKQAGQDKIAGTYVASKFVSGWQPVDPREIQRQRWRWLLILGIPSLVIISGFGYLIWGMLAEVREMGAWPSSDISLVKVAGVDLSALGFMKGQVLDARKTQAWTQGTYKDGIEVSYWLGNEEVAEIFALRYDSWLIASDDFNTLRVLNSESNRCGASASAVFVTYGMTRCQFSNQDNKIFWNGDLIIHIVTYEGSKFRPDVLVDRVRDAIALHWKALRQAGKSPM